MSGHTPGPWILDSVGHVYAEAEYKPAPFVDKDGVAYPDYMAGLVALPYGNNARLIAAAPDLLEALKIVRERCAGWHNLDNMRTPPLKEGPTWDEWERMTDAAIAKAEGRS